MKIGILTHYDVNNQGAQLQMYALYRRLEELGHAPIILTYTKNFDFNINAKYKNQVSLKSIPYLLKNYLFSKGLGLTLHNARKYKINQKYRLSTFTHENYATADLDIAIVGSDEVFSLEAGVNIMMYGHAVNTASMISYAPSFGQTNIDKIEKYHCKNLISSGLSKFKAISARDDNTAKMVEQLTGITPTLVCDPVLLYDFTNTHAKCEFPKQKYLVVYAYDRHMIEEQEIIAIKAYAKQHDLITVSPGTYHKWCDKNIVCNCIEWLEIFRGAEAVITDTFHGTIVSAISNVPMAVYIRSKINSNKLIDLINRLGVSDRRLMEINESNLENVFCKELDFNGLNKSIGDMRITGNDYLIEAIGKCESKGYINE